jgi:hypothetical protein
MGSERRSELAIPNWGRHVDVEPGVGAVFDRYVDTDQAVPSSKRHRVGRTSAETRELTPGHQVGHTDDDMVEPAAPRDFHGREHAHDAHRRVADVVVPLVWWLLDPSAIVLRFVA